MNRTSSSDRGVYPLRTGLCGTPEEQEVHPPGGEPALFPCTSVLLVLVSYES